MHLSRLREDIVCYDFTVTSERLPMPGQADIPTKDTPDEKTEIDNKSMATIEQRAEKGISLENKDRASTEKKHISSKIALVNSMNNDDKSEEARPEDEMIMSDLEERMKFL